MASEEERDRYFYDKIKSGEWSIRNFRFFLGVERMRVRRQALDDALKVLPEPMHEKELGAGGFNYALDQARANIEALKGGASQ